MNDKNKWWINYVIIYWLIIGLVIWIIISSIYQAFSNSETNEYRLSSFDVAEIKSMQWSDMPNCWDPENIWTKTCWLLKKWIVLDQNIKMLKL